MSDKNFSLTPEASASPQKAYWAECDSPSTTHITEIVYSRRTPKMFCGVTKVRDIFGTSYSSAPHSVHQAQVFDSYEEAVEFVIKVSQDRVERLEEQYLQAIARENDMQRKISVSLKVVQP